MENKSSDVTLKSTTKKANNEKNFRNKFQAFTKQIKLGFYKTKIFFIKYIRPVAKFLAKCIAIAIILNVISAYFWPELPEKIPTIYGFFNVFLRFGEYLFTFVFGGIASIFNGTFFEVAAANWAEFKDMLNDLGAWACSLHF